MPFNACRYLDATALRRGVSRAPLQKDSQRLVRCHGLAPWSLTLAATKRLAKTRKMPPPCAVESHARRYKTDSQRLVRCHRLAPWSLTLAATKRVAKTRKMPPPCAVESHARRYTKRLAK